jgi:hypothetical protein
MAWTMTVWDEIFLKYLSWLNKVLVNTWKLCFTP